MRPGENWTPQQVKEFEKKRAAKQMAERLLSDPENEWAVEYFEEYLDLKDWASGIDPHALPEAKQAAFRAIRQGSGGSLGRFGS